MAGQTIRRTIWRWAPGALVLAFALLLALSGSTGYAAPENVHSGVYQWAGEHPGQNVPVILQTSGQTSADEAVTNNGGVVKQDIDFISAIQADVPPSSLRALSRADGVEYISLDAPVIALNDNALIDEHKVLSEFPQAVKAPDVWGKGFYGDGVGVAVLDTGVSSANNPDFTGYSGANRIIASVAIDGAATTTNDGYGHGTHIAGIVAGDGDLSNGKYPGIAPGANIINVKISDDLGNSSMGDLLAGLQWVYQNKNAYNIRVVNLSLHSATAESYKTSPIDAAVEFLWTNGIFVVVASGNSGSVADAVSYPPANDPFVMTAGAIDDKGTDSTGDDVPASFSSFGITQDGIKKPELLTPGVNIVSDTDSASILYAQGLLTGKVVSPGPYLKLSGTSMAAGVMSGVAALVIQKHPNWTPGQLKCSLITKSRKLSGANSGFSVPRAGDTFNLSKPSCDSDTGLAPSYGLMGAPVVPLIGAVAYILDQPDPFAAAASIGIDPAAANFVTTTPDDPTVALSLDTVDWSAIKWEAIAWENVNWQLIDWDSIKWASIKWDVIKWASVNWDVIKWSSIKWDVIKWSAIKWNSVKWDAIKWDVIKWSAVNFDVIKWSAVNFDVIKWNSAGEGG